MAQAKAKPPAAPSKPKAPVVKIQRRSAMDFLKESGPEGRQSIMIPLDDIEPDPKQPRGDFRPVDGVIPDAVLAELKVFADQLFMRGQDTPIQVRPHPSGHKGKWMIVFGERRWRAQVLNRDLGREVTHIEAFIRKDDSDTGKAMRFSQLAENLQRKGLSDLDTAYYIRDMMEEFPDLQQKDIAAEYGMSPSYVTRVLGMLNPKYAPLIEKGYITYASILEQFKALSAEAQAAVVQAAEQQGKQITATDVRNARGKTELKPKELKVVQSSQAAAPVERSEPGVQDQITAKQRVSVGFSQFMLLANVLPPSTGMDVDVTITVKDLELAIKNFGRNPVKNKANLAQQLSDILADEWKKRGK